MGNLFHEITKLFSLPFREILGNEILLETLITFSLTIVECEKSYLEQSTFSSKWTALLKTLPLSKKKKKNCGNASKNMTESACVMSPWRFSVYFFLFYTSYILSCAYSLRSRLFGYILVWKLYPSPTPPTPTFPLKFASKF